MNLPVGLNNSTSIPPPYSLTAEIPRNSVDVRKFPKCSIISLSIIQIICGVASIGLGIASVSLTLYEFGSAIWCSPLYIISGSFGLASASKRNKCLITSFMILSILSACLSVIPLITYSIYIPVWGYKCNYDYNYYYYYYYDYYCQQDAATTSIYSFLLLFSLLELLVAIISSVYCCRCLCKSCCDCYLSGDASLNDQTRMYYYPNQQQVYMDPERIASANAVPQNVHYQYLQPPAGVAQHPTNFPGLYYMVAPGSGERVATSQAVQQTLFVPPSNAISTNFQQPATAPPGIARPDSTGAANFVADPTNTGRPFQSSAGANQLQTHLRPPSLASEPSPANSNAMEAVHAIPNTMVEPLVPN